MSVIVNPSPDPLARTLNLGDAPATQTGAGGQWVNAWSLAGVSAVQRADATNASEAWTAVKYTDVLSSALGGGDIYHGDLGASGQSAATSSVKQEIDGKEALRFNLTEAAQSVALNLSSFYANDDGTAYSEGARIRLFDADGNMVGESFVTANSGAGNQQIQLNSALAFRSVEISAGAQKADGSFSFGGYSNADGSFATDSFISGGVKHGSDLLVHSVSFALARPLAAADSYALDEDAQASTFASVLTNDKDANHTALSAVLQTGPSHGTLTLNADGTFSYHADANYFGTDSFTYKASNGKDLSDAAVVSLTINPVNDAPVAANDHVTTDEDSVVTGNVLDGSSGGQDIDVDHDTLTVTTAGTFTTAHGASVTLNANGNFSYNPTASSELQALTSGQTLVDGFDYSITDGHGGTSSAHVDVTVQGRAEASADSILLPTVASGAELTYYLRYTDTNGSSKWMQIDGYSVDSSADTNYLKGSGASVGNVVAGKFSIEMGSGKALTDFTSHMLRGTDIASIELEAYANSNAGPQVVQEYKLGTAFLTSVQTTAGDDGATSNALSFVYKTIGVSVAPLDQHGKPVTPLTVAWDVANKTVDNGSLVPTNGANADLNHLAPVVPSDAPLDYYVHIDGVDGWTALSSFSMGYSAETSVVKGGAAAVGKPVPSDVSLGLGLNQILTTLLKAEISGKSNASIQVEAYAPHAGADGRATLVDEYFFNQAFVDGVASSSNADNAVDLVYKSMTHSHLAYNPNTGQVDPISSSSMGYNVSEARQITAPNTNAEALSRAAMPTVAAGTELTYYLRYTDTNGSSQWMQIDSYTVDSSAASNYLKGSGASVGNAVAGKFSIEMGGGKALTDFTSHMLRGTDIASIELEAYANSGAGPQVVQEYKLGTAFLTSVQSTAGDDGATSNALSFVYKTIGVSVAPLDQHGKPMTPLTVAWDVANKTVDNGSLVPTNGANADLNHLAPVVHSDAPLDYYVHIDGVDGWTALSSFSMGYSAETSVVKGGAAAVGKPVPSDVSLGLGLSQILTTLLKAEISGKSNASIQVEAYAPHAGADGQATLVDEYFFNQAFVNGVTSSTDADNAVDLVYKSMTHSHLAYNPKTGQVDPISSGSIGYDVSEARQFTAPNAHADALSKAMMPTVAAATELTYYLRYTDTNGSSKWMHIDGYSVDSSADTNYLKGSGASVGIAVAGKFSIEMGSGKALTDFTSHMLRGTNIASIELEAYANSGAGPQVVQEYKLGTAFLTSVQTTAGDDGATSNALSFAYKTIGVSVAPLDQHGKPVTPLTVAWDVANKTVDNGALLPTNGANADLKHLATTEGTGAALEYYVHIDGVTGWTGLSSFSMGYSAESSVVKGAVGKPIPTDVTLGLGLNQILTNLLKTEISGKSNPSIQVEVYAPHAGADGQKALVEEYFFNKAFVSGVSSGTDAQNTIDLVYKSFTHSYLAYDERGRVDIANSGSVGYDVSAAEIIGAPAPHADLFHT